MSEPLESLIVFLWLLLPWIALGIILIPKMWSHHHRIEALEKVADKCAKLR